MISSDFGTNGDAQANSPDQSAPLAAASDTSEAAEPPKDLKDFDVTLRPSRRPFLLFISAVLLFAGTAYGISFWRGRPDPIHQIFASKLPIWQLQRNRGMIAAAGPELKEMQTTLRRYPQVSAALGRLDAAFPDVAAVKAAGEGLSDALFANHLPYYLDPQLIQRNTVLLSYAVVGTATWEAGTQRTFVRRLSRIDRLNIEMGLLGQTDGTRPIVFMDRIESLLLRDLLDATGKHSDAERGRPLTRADKAALFELRRLLAVRVGASALDALVEALSDREAAFSTMRGRLHNGQVHIEKPETFAFGEAWFEPLWPLCSLQNPGGPLILDTDLRNLANADEKLRTAEAQATIRTLLDEMAVLTEAHETRHALDDDSQGPAADAAVARARPVPAALGALLENDARFAGLAEQELRAYLAEMHDAPSAPCFSILQGIRQVRGRYVALTPHYYAHFLILGRLGGDETLANPEELLHRLCAEPEAALRARVADLWKEFYGIPLVPARRQPS